MRIIFFLLGLFTFNFISSGQSYQVEAIDDDNILFYNEVLISNNDNISIFGGGRFEIGEGSSIFFINYKENENIQDGYIVRTTPDIKVYLLSNATYFNNRITALHHAHSLWSEFSGLTLLGFDFSTNQAWMRGKESYYDQRYAGFDIDSNGNVFAVLNPDIPSQFNDYDLPNVFEIFFLDSLGSTVGKKGIQIVDSTFTSYHLSVRQTASHPDGGFYSIGKFENYNATGENASFILKTEQQGNPLSWKKITSHDIDYIKVDAFGEIYLLGKTRQQFNFTDNEENAVLIKLDKDLNEIWTKVYHAESFEFSQVSMNTVSDGSIYLGYSTSGAFPVILAKLDMDGEIIWEKGYPLYSPELDVMSDGSLMMLTRNHFNANNEIFSKQIISKTDTLGNIDNCETFPTCLQSTLVTTEFGTFQVDTFSIPDLDTLEVIVEPHEFHFSDFCDTPPPPSPIFSYKDSICVNSCERPFDTQNFFAHGIEWRLEGNGLDTLITDSLDFEYCFDQVGVYYLQQTIWFLGCAYDFEKEIIVTEQFEMEITPDSTTCNDFPASIAVESSTPNLSYAWSTGDNSQSIEVFEIGAYSVTVTDDLCTAVDSIWFRNIIEPECFVELSVPNAFTPDGDGVNDTFFPIGQFFELERILIFNRWGQKVYDGKGADIAWDGNCDDQPCVSDVYVYRIQYLNVLYDVVEYLTGDVTLIR